MSNDVVRFSRWSINSAIAGSKQLRKVKSYTVTDNSDAEHAFSCDSATPAGVVRKSGGVDIEFEVYAERGVPEVSWRKLKRAEEYFTLTREYPDGERVQYNRCTVANDGGEGDEQGGQMITVKIIGNQPEEL